MSELRDRIDELASLMQEFNLEQARLKGPDWAIEFSKTADVEAVVEVARPAASPEAATAPRKAKASKPKSDAPGGIPVTSPMTGIFYGSPSPGSPAFVKVGDTVTAGAVVGLIEAMKVFNEITATTTGTVTKIVAESGQLVNPGDPLLYIG